LKHFVLKQEYFSSIKQENVWVNFYVPVL
jgi:hypothetical protein